MTSAATGIRILAIETATEACSVALLAGESVEQRYETAPRGHAGLVLPFAETLLAEAGLAPVQLDAVAFGCGPGSFTGLRIAAGMAQGIAFGADVPLVPVSTLAALAQGVVREHGAEKVLVALDARMQEVYWGAYQSLGAATLTLVGEERVCVPQQVPVPQGDGWVGAGNGWAAYGDTLVERCAIPRHVIKERQLPQAGDVARLAAVAFQQGRHVPPEQGIPVYLRDKVVQT